jgi:predicted nucleic-acid-binding protein
MNALDTNALVRFLVVDDEKQANAVKRILLESEKKGTTVFIPAAVVLETIWVLSSVFNLSNAEIIKTLETILAMPVLEFEAHGRMVAFCHLAPTLHIDLSDILIGLTAQEFACETTLTFDRKASKSGLFTLIH